MQFSRDFLILYHYLPLFSVFIYSNKMSNSLSALCQHAENIQIDCSLDPFFRLSSVSQLEFIFYNNAKLQKKSVEILKTPSFSI